MFTIGKLMITCLVLTVSSNNAAKILAVFPTPSLSHNAVFRPLVLELIKRGHEVTFITSNPQTPKEATITNLIEIDIHDISYRVWIEKLVNTTTGQKDDTLAQIAGMLETLAAIFEELIKTNQMQELLKGKKDFDLLLAETCVRTTLAFTHIFQIPAILISSFGPTLDVNYVIGAARHPILYPTSTRQKINNLTAWEKISELYTEYKVQRIMNEYLNKENALLKKLFGPGFPTYEELSNNVQMSFLNIHPLWDNNRPVPPSVIYMGGIHQNPIKKLPQEMERYLNSSKNGVIYISFGTNVVPSMLPRERTQIMVEVFSELPYDVIWKYDKDELPGKPKNVKLSKWLPQSDLLRHPKIKLFITQGGLQSTDESITAGVPLIGMPMLIDQWYNVELYERHKIGVRIDMESMTKEIFKNAIQTVIEDVSYKNNIIKLRSIMNDQPQMALERAVWWIEYVLRYGGKHLRSPAANMSWTEYLELELVAAVLLTFVFFLILIVLLSLYVLRFIKRDYVTKMKVKNN